MSAIAIPKSDRTIDRSSRRPCICTEESQSKTEHYSPSFSLRLEQGEDVVEPDGTLDVSDDRSVGLVHELDSDLSDTSSGSGSAKDLKV